MSLLILPGSRPYMAVVQIDRCALDVNTWAKTKGNRVAIFLIMAILFLQWE